MIRMTKGNVNKLIDLAIHPLFRKSKAFVIVDGVAHALNERNPKESAIKFVRYNLRYLLEDK